MKPHRHLDVDPATPVTDLGLAAIDDIIDRGDLDDWMPLLREIRRDPWGPVAADVLRIVERHPRAGTTRLFRSFVERERGGSEPAVGPSLRRLRQSHGLTQAEMASRLGMTQPEVSRLESRADTRISTARAYVRALGGRLELSAGFGDTHISIDFDHPNP